jgi:hypothetical protein
MNLPDYNIYNTVEEYREKYGELFSKARQLTYDIDSMRDSYQYMERNYQEIRNKYDNERKKISDFHELFKEYYNHMLHLFRTKQIQSVAEFNNLSEAWGKLSNGWLGPIKAEDIYSAKAIINIEGVYYNDKRDLDAIKKHILFAFENNNTGSITVNHFEIQDVYDVEEMTQSKEG